MNWILQGNLKADTNLNKFPTEEWVSFAWTNGLTISGTGTLDGQGGATWHLNDCRQNEKCKLLPIVSVMQLALEKQAEIMFYCLLRNGFSCG